MNILVPNLGSTSLKYQILEMPSERKLAAGKLERVCDYRGAIGQIRTAVRLAWTAISRESRSYRQLYLYIYQCLLLLVSS